MERLAVTASYKVTLDSGATQQGRVQFVARVADASKGYDLLGRAKRAVARRLKCAASKVAIVGVESF